MGRKKEGRIHIRVSEQDKEKLLSKAAEARLSMSEYIIALSERKKIYVVDGLPELCVQIIKIGTNINQVTHTINAQKTVSDKQVEYLNSSLIEIQNLLGKLIDEVKSSTDEEIKV